jgi:hypothetical protein
VLSELEIIRTEPEISEEEKLLKVIAMWCLNTMCVLKEAAKIASQADAVNTVSV